MLFLTEHKIIFPAVEHLNVAHIKRISRINFMQSEGRADRESSVHPQAGREGKKSTK